MKNMPKENVTKLVILLLVIPLFILVSYMIYEQHSLVRDVEVLAGIVRIADHRYVYSPFVSKGRKKKNAEIDNWNVYEIKEDPNHIFLQLKSFTGEQYLVREDYQIPTEGKVSCVYVDGRRINDRKITEAFDEILTTEYDDCIDYYVSGNKEEQEKWMHFVIGYEDCPVGTDNSIYGITQIDSRWVVVFQNDVFENTEGGFKVIYHVLSPECGQVFEESKLWG